MKTHQIFNNLSSSYFVYYLMYYFLRLTHLGALLPDRLWLKLKFRCYMKQRLNLDNPCTFNEKLQWLKLNDRNPAYTTLVDKYLVKDYIAKTIGQQYVIPLLGVWDSVEDISWDKLPNQFVLKCNHDSGSIVICKDKKTFNRKDAEKVLAKGLKTDSYWYGREWPYKNIKRKIIAEAYMEDSTTNELRDYKFFMFNGECKALFIASERQKKGEDTKFDFFDSSFHHLDIRHGHPNAKVLPNKPLRFDEMIELASKLSVGIPHVRVDFYEVDGRVYFGEMTFYHHTGMVPFDPPIWDRIFGEWIVLPQKKQ